MGKEFIERQLDRRARRLPDEIYDVTAWSLPMTFGVDMLEARGACGGRERDAQTGERAGERGGA